jgi:competence protein ComEA
MLHRWVRNFFGFSRSQTNAFIILLPLLTTILFSEPAYRWWRSNRAVDFAGDQAKLDSLIALWDTPKKDSLSGDTESSETTRLFAFDPNKISESELQSLGFPKNLSSRIAHYREKGGRFRVKADLLKIYGVDSAFYLQLFPFIQLPEKSAREDEY